MNERNLYVYVITCYTLDFASRLEMRVCGVFKREADAEQYLKENKGAQPEEVGHEIHEVEWAE